MSVVPSHTATGPLEQGNNPLMPQREEVTDKARAFQRLWFGEPGPVEPGHFERRHRGRIEKLIGVEAGKMEQLLSASPHLSVQFFVKSAKISKRLARAIPRP